MEQEEQKIFYLDLALKKDSFKSTFKQESTVHKVLSRTNFNLISGIEINLLPQQEIDDISFDKIVFLFESASITKNSIQHFIIKEEKGNHLSPNTFKKLLFPFTKNVKKLELYISDHAGHSINEWLLMIVKAIQQTENLEKAFIEVKKLFTIFYQNGYLKIRIKTGITKDEEYLQSIAKLCEKLQFKYFSLKIEDDNFVKRGLDFLAEIFTLKQSLEQISLTIGQSCQLISSQPFFDSIKHHKIQTLKLKIGNSNQLESSVLINIVNFIEQGLKELKLDIGSSTRFFSSALQLTTPLKQNNIEKLVFKIGKNNSFQNGGANILALFLDTIKLKIVKISIGDSFQMTDLQSLQMFLLLQKLRTVTQLELQFERDICVNKHCLQQLEKLITKSTNLMSLSINFSKQQQQLNLSNLLNTLGSRKTLINIDLGIGGQQTLPNLKKFGQQIRELEFLSSFKIHLKGSNSLDYKDFRNFLYEVKHNLNLNLLVVKVGQQFDRQQQEKEYRENSEIVKILCLIGKPIIVHYSHLNDQISYQYNFDRLQLIGITNCISQNILIPVPANQLIIKITNNINDVSVLQNILSLIKNQDEIRVSANLIELVSNVDGATLTLNSPQVLDAFCKFTTKNITTLNFMKEISWSDHFNLIYQLCERQVSSSCYNIDFRFKNIHIKFKDQQLDIMRVVMQDQNDEANQEQQFTNLCQLIELLSAFDIHTLNIDFPIFTFSQNWEGLKIAITKLEYLQSLTLRLRNSGVNQGHCRDYYNFQKSITEIFINNLFLTRYDYFAEEDVFPKALQFHLGNGIKAAEQELQQKEAQRDRIVNGQQTQEDLNVNLIQLNIEIQQMKDELELRNRCVEEGKAYSMLKRKVLLKKQKAILGFWVAQKKFGNRGFKLQSLTGIVEMF